MISLASISKTRKTRVFGLPVTEYDKFMLRNSFNKWRIAGKYKVVKAVSIENKVNDK